jgi:hypothetical protein
MLKQETEIYDETVRKKGNDISRKSLVWNRKEREEKTSTLQ